MPRKRSRSKSRTGRSSSRDSQKTAKADKSWDYTLYSLRYAFLAKREIHMAVIEILQGVTLLTGFCTLVLAFVFGISAVVVKSFAVLEFVNITILLGICIVQPKVVAFALPVTKDYVKSEQRSSTREKVSFPMLYVAHTGYYVNNDRSQPILGVYAAERIKKGYAFHEFPIFHRILCLYHFCATNKFCLPELKLLNTAVWCCVQ